MDLGVGTVQDRVAFAHGVRRAVLPRAAAAAEHDDDLLLVDVHVRGHDPRAGLGAEPAEPGRQPLALPAQLAAIDPFPGDVIPVDHHAGRKDYRMARGKSAR